MDLDPLDSAWARRDRGREHMKRLYALMASHTAAVNRDGRDVVMFAQHADPDAEMLSISVESVALDTRWALIIADAVHNFRCALDHLVWELCFVDGDGVAPKGRGIFPSFPLILRANRSWRECSRSFDAESPSKLPGVTTRHRAMIKRRQPYHRWDRANGPGVHPFAMLSALDNDNKHRTVQPAFAAAAAIALAFANDRTRDCHRRSGPVISYPTAGRPLHPGTKLWDIPVAITGPDPHMYVETEYALTVAFRNGTDVGLVLEGIEALVTEILNEFAPVFETAKAQRVWRPREERIHSLPPVDARPLPPPERSGDEVRRQFADEVVGRWGGEWQGVVPWEAPSASTQKEEA